MTHKFAFALLVAGLMLAVSIGAAQAAVVEYTWDGGSASTNDWMNSDNWDPNGTPAAGAGGDTTSYVIDSTTGGTALTSGTAFAGDDLKLATGGLLKNTGTNATASGTVTFAGGTFQHDHYSNRTFTAGGGFIVQDGTTSTVEVTNAGLTLSGALSGAGTLNKAGVGMLKLSSASTGFTGTLNINDGMVEPVSQALVNANVHVNSGGKLSLFNGPTLNHLTLDGGTLVHSASKSLTFTGNIDVLARSFLVNSAAGSTTLAVTLTGGGNLVLSNGGGYSPPILLGNSFDSSAYTGTLEMETGTKVGMAGHDLTVGGLLLDGNSVTAGVYSYNGSVSGTLSWTDYVAANSWADGYVVFGSLEPLTNTTTNTLTITVPEPATLAFLAVGGLALAGSAVRRRRRA